jgi:ribosomal protein S3
LLRYWFRFYRGQGVIGIKVHVMSNNLATDNIAIKTKMWKSLSRAGRLSISSMASSSTYHHWMRPYLRPPIS